MATPFHGLKPVSEFLVADKMQTEGARAKKQNGYGFCVPVIISLSFSVVVSQL